MVGWRVRATTHVFSRDWPTLQCPVSKISDIIATRSMIATPHKQQIPPLRCASVGMTIMSITSQIRPYVDTLKLNCWLAAVNGLGLRAFYSMKLEDVFREEERYA
jgi:hypothetical protein